MITDLVESLNFDELMDSLEDLLDYEIKINDKKINNIPLTEDEYIFDTYLIKPSTMVRFILKGDKKN